MFYEYNVPIPANTAQNNELSTLLRLSRGFIRRVELVFPRGCAGLVGVRIFRGNLQVIPLNFPAWIDTDDEVVKADTEIDLTVNPFELEFRGYNLDDTYSHNIRVRVLIEKAEAEFSVKPAGVESRELMERIGL